MLTPDAAGEEAGEEARGEDYKFGHVLETLLHKGPGIPTRVCMGRVHDMECRNGRWVMVTGAICDLRAGILDIPF